MTYRIERRGWLPDPKDPRDLTIRDTQVQRRLKSALPRTASGVTRSAAVTPAGALQVDLRKWCAPIEDQGQIGSCTAHAVIGALEYFERKTRGEHVDASRLFLYRVTRRFLGWEGRGDTGAFIRDTIKSLRLFGAPPESYWPYSEERYDHEPEAFHYAYAQNFKAVEYFRLEGRVMQLKSALDSGLPFAFGFTCFSSLDAPEVGETGVIPYPSRRESSTGGHAVLAVGYTDTHVLIRNSWGRGWGNGGYGYLPWQYFDERRPLADDCWALVNASWVPDSEPEAPSTRPTLAMRTKATSWAPVVPEAFASPPAPLEPYVQVVRGIDPLTQIPLTLTAKGVLTATAATTGLTRSTEPIALYLRNLRLNKSFEWDLFKPAVNNIYLVAVTWDLSGAPPRVFPPAELSAKLPAAAVLTYDLTEGETVDFVGDGLQLWPAKQIVGGLYVRIFVAESDEEKRALGRRIAEVNDAVAASPLTSALEVLAVAAGATTVALGAVVQAASALTGLVAGVLAKNADDPVALFDGTYAPEHATDRQSYRQRGATIELDFRREAAAPERRGRVK